MQPLPDKGHLSEVPVRLTPKRIEWITIMNWLDCPGEIDDSDPDWLRISNGPRFVVIYRRSLDLESLRIMLVED